MKPSAQWDASLGRCAERRLQQIDRGASPAASDGSPIAQPALHRQPLHNSYSTMVEVLDAEMAALAEVEDRETSGSSEFLSNSREACFLDAAFVLAPDKRLIAVRNLTEGQLIQGSNGANLQVRTLKHLPSARRQLVELTCQDVTITVTKDHRMVVVRGGPQGLNMASPLGLKGLAMPYPARQLKRGDQLVFSDSSERTLTRVRLLEADVPVYRLTLCTNECFAVYSSDDLVPCTFMTYGHRGQPVRRGRGNRCRNSQASSDTWLACIYQF